GSEWIEYNGNCYYWSRTIVENWFRAELTCQKSGGHLVSIGSLSDNNFLLRLTQCRVSFWIGLVNTVHSLKAQHRGYEWWDHRQHNYTALNPRSNTTSIASTSDRCPSGWQLLDNSCYYVMFNKTNYFNAQMSCQAMGATVTSILTPREHTLLTVAIGCNAPTWIGLEKARPCFRQPNRDHCWVWMDRSPTVHFDWASGQTVDRRDAECVILDGQWKVVNCYAEYGYICKRHSYDLAKDVIEEDSKQ
uniref:C-type lectin domain-containing protein n=1 Tax=Macrostomum lignano TaxID=282301 RepID=A0A1I8FY43_9PLAT